MYRAARLGLTLTKESKHQSLDVKNPAHVISQVAKQTNPSLIQTRVTTDNNLGVFVHSVDPESPITQSPFVIRTW